MSWKTVTTHPLYEVSDAGEVRNSVTGRMMKFGLTGGGYPKVNLSPGMKTVMIHRLVALHFIENPENKPCVDHIDRVKTNNHVSNLRWATLIENARNTDYRTRNTYNHHICITHCKTFQVRITGRTAVSKTFDTLEEAVAFRDQWMTDNPR
jgi:hypothetical protein